MSFSGDLCLAPQPSLTSPSSPSASRSATTSSLTTSALAGRDGRVQKRKFSRGARVGRFRNIGSSSSSSCSTALDRIASSFDKFDSLGPVRGADLTISVSLSFHEASNGCSKLLSLNRYTRCTSCLGLGWIGNGSGPMTTTSLKFQLQQQQQREHQCEKCRAVGETATICPGASENAATTTPATTCSGLKRRMLIRRPLLFALESNATVPADSIVAADVNASTSAEAVEEANALLHSAGFTFGESIPAETVEIDRRKALFRRSCSNCAGSGRITVNEQLRLEFAAGVGPSAVHLPGKGDAGEHGGATGDLIVSLSIQTHPFLESVVSVDGAACTVRHKIFRAQIGKHITVSTPFGDATLLVPSEIPDSWPMSVKVRGAGLYNPEIQQQTDLTVLLEKAAAFDAVDPIQATAAFVASAVEHQKD